MEKAIRATEVPSDHQKAVALLEEMAGCLKLPMDYMKKLAQEVSGRPWDGLGSRDAEAVVELLAEALYRYRSLKAQGLHH